MGEDINTSRSCGKQNSTAAPIKQRVTVFMRQPCWAPARGTDHAQHAEQHQCADGHLRADEFIWKGVVIHAGLSSLVVALFPGAGSKQTHVRQIMQNTGQASLHQGKALRHKQVS